MACGKLDSFADAIIAQGRHTEADREIIICGLSTAIKMTLNIITTIVLGILFGMIIESLLFLVSFAFLRTYSGGYHCEKALNCYLMSSGIVVLVLAIVKFTPEVYMPWIGIIILLISIPSLLKFAPVAAKHKPLDEIERKHYRRKTFIHLAIECIAVGCLFGFGFYDLGSLLALGIFSVTILVLTQKVVVKFS